MHVEIRILVWGIVLALLAGCSQASDDGGNSVPEPTTGDGGSQSATPTEDPGEVEPPFGKPTEFFWTDCTGASALVYLAPQPPVPDGWEEIVPPAIELYYDFAECERVSIGPFERGPVRFMMEHSSAGAPPDSCLENGTFRRPSLMHNWWLDDADIATYLHEELGMPALHADFTVSRQDLDGAETLSIEWGASGDERSNMTFIRHGYSGGSIPLEERIFWFNSTSTAYMDTLFDSRGYDAGGPLTGNLAAPSVYAVNGMTTPIAAAKGAIDVDLALETDLRYFSDPECKTPA